MSPASGWEGSGPAPDGSLDAPGAGAGEPPGVSEGVSEAVSEGASATGSTRESTDEGRLGFSTPAAAGARRGSPVAGRLVTGSAYGAMSRSRPPVHPAGPAPAPAPAPAPVSESESIPTLVVR